jgi:triosephosphate isomerase
MLADIGARYVIVGHSERRAQHHESSELVARKAAAAHRAGLIPIICVGETLAVREAGRAEAAVVDELERSLHANADEFENLVVAYEPVWAIGTGRTCASRDIAAMHEVLRRRLTEKHPALAETRILYGGSVKSDNAREILSIPNVDGALVGGASLDAKSFLAIAEAAS